MKDTKGKKSNFLHSIFPPPTGRSHEAQSWLQRLQLETPEISVHLLVSQPAHCSNHELGKAWPRTPFRDLFLPITSPHCWTWNPSEGPLELVPFLTPSVSDSTRLLAGTPSRDLKSQPPTSQSIYLSGTPLTMPVWDCGVQPKFQLKTIRDKYPLDNQWLAEL